MGFLGKLFGFDSENSYPNWIEKYAIYPEQVRFEPLGELVKEGRANKDEKALFRAFQNGEKNDYFGAKYRIYMPCPSCGMTSTSTSSKDYVIPGAQYKCTSCHKSIFIHSPKKDYHFSRRTQG